MLRVHSMIWGSVFWVQLACSSLPLPSKPPVRGETVHQQKELGPILGPITKEKVLDRLKGYPLCGVETPERKKLLLMKFTPLKGAKLPHNSKPSSLINQDKELNAHAITQHEAALYLVSTVCISFGVQGAYEFALLNPQQGRVYPLAFQGAIPLKRLKLNVERKNPVHVDQGRSEVCGSAKMNGESLELSVKCKGDARGGCGAYARYQLALTSEGTVNLDHPHFQLIEARFQSCEQAPNPDVSQWAVISP